MKKLFVLSIILGFFLSCDETDDVNRDTELIGTWKLVELYSDPGDGSGRFNRVNSEKVIIFKEDGALTSNGSICEIDNVTTNPTSGTYSITDSTFRSDDCNNPDYDYEFIKTEGTITVYYPCIEGCAARYRKQ
ncbi:hypothetical protein [Nonlabens marinus]|uniref:Lipocalin-like domain-containing protein n=1 Tax=Nonlabens marinus S1-08 TaxID=1454201 RepID=W8VPZ5_9FLAO|nr:hypothetical protein [Nonlabens marinus]BAO54745.1 hypothetical protein NMS_0736 [Nonlabens marinus S1-08]